jgi:hypothetical protein
MPRIPMFGVSETQEGQSMELVSVIALNFPSPPCLLFYFPVPFPLPWTGIL